ncbi:transcriptional regulator, XRE family [Moritella sp. JT01]|uniref:helix-turn-helix domain-containing protein n=1 Tax=unclassified Moritella TaxID=2637987 RepID=UPI00079440F7|nr:MULTISPECIES: helix-turn-helix transcriptional regulator [unclassified Moritella]KXO06554.1 transcriptional regulator, XRE family [Moritella sp. JT01]NQZ94004.1 helix-turn-helix transcriptional regulator [Moritella sp.]
MDKIENITKLLSDRRKELGMEQADMYMRIGMKQQQYQRIEAGSDIKLSTLLRVLEGLDLELSITPKNKSKHLQQTKLENIDSIQSLEDDTDDLDFWFGSEDNK